MSSRVLPGEAAVPAEPITWRRVSGHGLAAEPAAEPEAQRKLSQLQARIAELEAEMRQRLEQAYQEGRRQGQAQAEEQAAARLEPVLARLGRTVEELAGQRRRLRREAEEDVVKLAVAVARRILHRELHMDPEALLGVVKAALKRLEGQEVHRVRVHPADADLVRRHFEELGLAGKVAVEGDAALGRGAAVFETPQGSLDASVGTQLQEIQRGLADRVRGT